MEKRGKIILASLVIAISLFAVVLIYIRTFVPNFEIVSHNGVLGVESIYPETRYNYTVYAEIKNVLGVGHSTTVNCELTREDLTKITKQETISVYQGKTKIVEFFFSNEDLKGTS